MYGFLFAGCQQTWVYCLSDVSLCQYAWRGSPFGEYGEHGKGEREDPVKDLLLLRKTLVRPSLIDYIFI
jgi:hypothetical protein